MGIFNRVIRNAISGATISVGDAIGKSVGNAVGAATVGQLVCKYCDCKIVE